MKRLTHNNLMKATKMIEKKGYDTGTAMHLARNVFEEAEFNKSSGRSVEWYIERILTAEEYEKTYPT